MRPQGPTELPTRRSSTSTPPLSHHAHAITPHAPLRPHPFGFFAPCDPPRTTRLARRLPAAPFRLLHTPPTRLPAPSQTTPPHPSSRNHAITPHSARALLVVWRRVTHLATTRLARRLPAAPFRLLHTPHHPPFRPVPDDAPPTGVNQSFITCEYACNRGVLCFAPLIMMPEGP